MYFLCCCDVLTMVCFKTELRYSLFYGKQSCCIDFRGKLFGKQCYELQTVLCFWSASQFSVVVALLFFLLIFRSHKNLYNGSILLAKSGTRHCTLQRNYSAVPHKSRDWEDIAVSFQLIYYRKQSSQAKWVRMLWVEWAVGYKI